MAKKWVAFVLAGTVACGSGAEGGDESDAASSGSSGGDAHAGSSGSSGSDAADATSSGSSGSDAADADASSRIGSDADASSRIGSDADATASGANDAGEDGDAAGALGHDADAGPSSPFVGSWSCPYTTNSGYMDSTPFVFSQNPDGTLSSTSMIEIDACTLQWTVSGSTATAVAGEQCGGFTVNSYTFALEQGPEQGIAFAVATAIEHGTNVESDGGTSPVDIAGSFAGFCTKDGTGDGGTPTLCEPDPVVGCGAGSVGYLCLGTYSPQALDASISCPELFIGGSSCCTIGPGGDP